MCKKPLLYEIFSRSQQPVKLPLEPEQGLAAA
jgi:hypothetical protein